jgi:hypothetical protein
MSHEYHDIHTHCDHDLKYCKTCDVPYCTKCGREWKAHTFITPYTIPQYPKYPATTNWQNPPVWTSGTSDNVSVGMGSHNHYT